MNPRYVVSLTWEETQLGIRADGPSLLIPDVNVKETPLEILTVRSLMPMKLWPRGHCEGLPVAPTILSSYSQQWQPSHFLAL